MTVPYAFASATNSIPLSELDANFNTPITLGNTAIQLGNTVTTLNNMTLANATVSSGNVTITSANLSGNLNFTGTGNRITGDFSNSTIASRVILQTSTTNGQTRFTAIPNGTSTTGIVEAYNSSDTTNASIFSLTSISTEARLAAGIAGTGTYQPMTFYTNGSEAMRIDTAGDVGIGTSSPAYPLQVSTAAETNIAITGGTTSETNIFFGDSGSAVIGRITYNNNGDYMRFYVNAAERLRINSSGNVIVGSGEGTATPVGNILRAPDAVGTNIAGANLDIKPGASTGSATGGNVSFYSGVTPGASGTTANSLTERMRITSTGTAADSPSGVVISVSGVYPSTIPITNNGDRLQSLLVHGLSEATASIGIVNWGASTGDEPNLNFMSLNSGTVGSFGTVPVSGTNLGLITFEGYSGSGSDMLSGAAIFAESSGTWTSTYAPSILRLQTATATSTLASRIVIDEDLAYIASDTGFQISEIAVTTGSSAIGNVFSGTYTPSLANTTNITTSTPYQFQYTRIGNVVTVSGRVNIDPTASATASELGISLPIASAFPASATGVSNLAGVGSIHTTTTEVSTGGILADTTNDRAQFRFVSGGTAARDYAISFTYLVV